MPNDTPQPGTEDQTHVGERRPPAAAFAISPIDRDRTGQRHVVAVVVVALMVVALNLLPSSEPTADKPDPTAPVATPTAAVVASSPAIADRVRAAPVHHSLRLSPVWLDVDIPVGWTWSTVVRSTVVVGDQNGPRIRVTFDQDVVEVRTRLCVAASDFIAVGTTASDMVAALTRMAGDLATGVSPMVIGDHLATRFSLTLPPSCPEPAEGVTLWRNADGTEYTPLRDAVVVVYVVDVDGDRLVITTDGRGATQQDLDDRDRIIGSLRISGGHGVFSTFDPGARHQTGFVDDIGLSISGPGYGWESHGPYLSKNVAGPQGAEVAVLLTTYPGGSLTEPCTGLIGPVGPSIGDLAAALASAPGTELVSAPADAIIGGLAAVRLVVAVTALDPEACQPGLYFSWTAPGLGALWDSVGAGDEITVWIVDVADTRLVIEVLAHPAIDAQTRAEIGRLIDTLGFDGFVPAVPSLAPEMSWYSQQVGAICAAATERWGDAVGVGVDRLEPDTLPAIAVEAEAAVRIADETIAALRTVPAPEAEREWTVHQIDRLGEAIDVLRELAAAARAGDLARVEELQRIRVMRTHEKDGFVDPYFWDCPLALPA